MYNIYKDNDHNICIFSRMLGFIKNVEAMQFVVKYLNHTYHYIKSKKYRGVLEYSEIRPLTDNIFKIIRKCPE